MIRYTPCVADYSQRLMAWRVVGKSQTTEYKALAFLRKHHLSQYLRCETTVIESESGLPVVSAKGMSPVLDGGVCNG